MAGLRRGRKKRPRPISTVNTQTCLFVEDEREVANRIKVTKRSREEIVRKLEAAGVRSERLRAVGKDEALSDVINA